MFKRHSSTPTSIAAGKKGFTLIEIMIAVAIIGILSSIAIPNYLSFRRKAFFAEIVTNLKHFEKGFMGYAAEYGQLPDDSHLQPPYNLPNVEVEGFIPVSAWVKATFLGGNYNWEGPNNYPYAGISIFGATASNQDMALLDSLLDNGDLATGKFRITPNGRYTYIISE